MKREEIQIRDPFVLVENGIYYLIGTTGSDPWGRGSDLQLFVSRDLEEFEKRGVMVTDGSLSSYKNIWAPELHEYRGKYYLIVSADRKDVGRGCFIYVSDRVDGDYKMLTEKYVTPEGWGCLDATLFVFENKPYLCFSNEWLTPITKDGDGSLYMAELSEDLTEMIGEPKKIVSGKNSGIAIEVRDKTGTVKGYIAEGPYLYEEDGNIVLLWSTVGKSGYTVIRSVSKNGVFGKYEFDRIVFEEDGGHCMCFTDLKGNRLLTVHQPNDTPNERMKIFPF